MKSVITFAKVLYKIFRVTEVESVNRPYNTQEFGAIQTRQFKPITFALLICYSAFFVWGFWFFKTFTTKVFLHFQKLKRQVLNLWIRARISPTSFLRFDSRRSKGNQTSFTADPSENCPFKVSVWFNEELFNTIKKLQNGKRPLLTHKTFY